MEGLDPCPDLCAKEGEPCFYIGDVSDQTNGAGTLVCDWCFFKFGSMNQYAHHLLVTINEHFVA